MTFVYFILTAAVTIFTATKLSNYSDVISNKTALGGAFVGTILLAGATSLPEVTTSVSAVIIGNADIAVGNMLGSNLFNFVIIASFDLYFRKRKLFLSVKRKHIYTAGLGLFLTLMVLLSLWLQLDYAILGIGIDSILITAVYFTGITIISKVPNKSNKEDSSGDKEKSSEDSSKENKLTVKQAIIGFITAALIIMGAGTVLSIMGDRIATITGIGSSFVGSVLIAATTSLPESVSVFTALKLKNMNMALGSILGSNMFNMLILGGSDIFYRKGAILSAVSFSHIYTAIGISVLSFVMISAIVRKRSPSVLRYSIPSGLIVIGYFVTSYLIYTH